VIDGHNWHATRTWQAVAIELANALELHVTPFGQRAVQNQRDDATRFDGSSEP
jgi:hypothetical protein